jgi:serine phosphatase RsbU (regulator of sigma subunit)
LKRWLLPGLLAVAATIWLVWAFPRFHPSARLGLALDRDGYIAQARTFATNHGVNTDGWHGVAKAESSTDRQILRDKMPNDEIARTFPSGVVTATLRTKGGDDHGGATAEVTLRPDGRTLGWEFPAQKTKLPGDPKAIAESALRELVGDGFSKYQIVNGGTPDHGGWLFAWERTETSPDTPTIRVEVHVENGKVKQVETNFKLPEGLGNHLDRFGMIPVVAGFVWFPLLIASVVVAIVRDGALNTAKSMRDHAAIWLSAAVPVLFLSSVLIDWEEEFAGSSMGGKVTTGLGLALGAVLLGLLFYAVLSATILNARLQPTRVRGLRLLPTKGFFNRLTGTEMLGGFLSAPMLVSIPLAISAILRVPAQHGYDDDTLLSRFPAMNLFLGLGNQETLAHLAFLGILIPAALRIPAPRWLSSRWLHWSGIAIAGVATYTMLLSPFRQDVFANVPMVVLYTALMIWVYTQFGVLGAITAVCAARVVVGAGALLVQPAAGLHASGATILTLLGCGVVYALAAAWKGPEVTTQLFGESGLTAEPRTRREALLQEFNVARSAQQQMLPARPPVLPGYTIAASCEPAREVGGDLYDFMRLQDGRVGIGVADVSGKGVPAALYMTLTKGLLCAASQDSNDPHEILTSVNTHLREAVRKKMFVTMALGVLDVETGTLEHVRAGHNPIVWRRAALGETRMLTTPGIALGVAGPALFSKTLAAETIVLGPGDALVFYSDGLTEAMNESLEQFGDDRLLAAVENADGLPAEATRDSILSEVKDFLHGGQSQDDLTLAVLRVADGR